MKATSHEEDDGQLQKCPLVPKLCHPSHVGGKPIHSSRTSPSGGSPPTEDSPAVEAATPLRRLLDQPGVGSGWARWWLGGATTGRRTGRCWRTMVRGVNGAFTVCVNTIQQTSGLVLNVSFVRVSNMTLKVTDLSKDWLTYATLVPFIRSRYSSPGPSLLMAAPISGECGTLCAAVIYMSCVWVAGFTRALHLTSLVTNNFLGVAGSLVLVLMSLFSKNWMIFEGTTVFVLTLMLSKH